MTEVFDAGFNALPLGDLDPRKFEQFVADLLEEEAEAGKHGSQFDRVSLLPEGSDEGRDIELLRHGVPVGIVQCKRYSKNISHEQSLKEIIKFLLFARLNTFRMPDTKGFLYFLAAAYGVTNKTRELFNQWPKSLTVSLSPEIFFEKFQLQIALTLVPRFRGRPVQRLANTDDFHV